MSDLSDLTGYNLVLASTEAGLNDSLEYANFWKVPINYQTNPDVDPASSPGLVNVHLSQPTLRLSGGDLASNQLAVSVQFSSGTLRYVNINTGGMLDADISGWGMVFAANIGQGEIPAGTSFAQLPIQVQRALSNELLSVGQLFLELNTVNWANVSITDEDGQAVTDSIISSTLEEAIQGWAQSVESALQQWVLSYVITGAGSGGSPSENVLNSLVPTRYNFSVSKYNPAGEYDDLSTLNYLMMTEGQAAPTANSAGIFDFNWVEGPNTQDYQGALSIQGSLFNSAYVESQLLPAIATAVGASNPVITSQGTGSWNINQYVDLYGDQHEGKGEKTKDLGLETVYQDIIEQLNCNVVLDAANATYHISGTYYARTNITVQFVKWDATDSKYHGDYTLPWSFSILLKPGAGGTIIAESTAVQQGEPTQSTGGDNFGGDIFNFVNELVDGFVNTYTADFQDKAVSITDSDFTAASNQLGTTLTTLAGTVVFPAGNRFAYKDICFSDDAQQDLIAYLTYLS
jgi:hypothetical protein